MRLDGLARRQARTAWLLLLPMLAALAIVALWPLSRTIWFSLTDANNIEAAGSVRNKSCDGRFPRRSGDETGMVEKCRCPARQAMNHAIMAVMLLSVTIRGLRPVI